MQSGAGRLTGRTEPPSETRIVAIDSLRGLAALSVCLFHLTQFGSLLPRGRLAAFGAWGWLGVEVFFVISGFIIPHALDRSHYRLSRYGQFLLRRIIRLDPPYLCSIALVLAVTFLLTLAPGYEGAPFRPSPAGVLAHLLYLNAALGYEWLNPRVLDSRH